MRDRWIQNIKEVELWTLRGSELLNAAPATASKSANRLNSSAEHSPIRASCHCFVTLQQLSPCAGVLKCTLMVMVAYGLAGFCQSANHNHASRQKYTLVQTRVLIVCCFPPLVVKHMQTHPI